MREKDQITVKPIKIHLGPLGSEGYVEVAGQDVTRMVTKVVYEADPDSRRLTLTLASTVDVQISGEAQLEFVKTPRERDVPPQR